MKTKTEIDHSIIGMDIESDNELNRTDANGDFVNSKLHSKIDMITDLLNKQGILDPISWKPFPDEPSEYQEAIQHLAAMLCVSIIGKTKGVLSTTIPFPNRFLELSVNDTDRVLLLSGNSYEVRLDTSDGEICEVIPPDKHKCSGVVYCSCPSGSPFLPLTWVTHSDNNEIILSLNVKVTFEFTKEDN